MSAIYGFVGSCASDADADLARMGEAMRHRGPDGAVLHVHQDEQIGLGVRHLRLSDADPSAKVATSEDGMLLMVCDGQVFNRNELTKWLEERGHRVDRSSSSDILLHLIEEEGIKGLRRVDGQFAAALWNRRERRLTLLRDFLGVRPLYYCVRPGGIAFASEIKGLVQHHDVPSEVDETAVSHYLTFLNVPGPRTLFAGLSKLAAGTCLTWDNSNGVQLQRYWSLLDGMLEQGAEEGFYVERVRALHSSAVKNRSAEGPIGALLSGGNDSSANAAYMARFGCKPLHTYTVGLAGFEGQEKYSDLVHARKVAELIGSEHHEALMSVDEFIEKTLQTVEAMDDLVSEPSSVFLLRALELARDCGTRVVLTGEANDELSCGHGEMHRIRDGYYQRWLPYSRQPRWIRRFASALAPLVSPKRKEVLSRAADPDGEYFWNYETAWMETEKSYVLAADVWRRCQLSGAGKVVSDHVRTFRNSDHAHRDYLDYMIYVMMQDYYFGNLMLGKLDLLSAFVSVEPRCPYTAPDYAHFVYNIPARHKYRDGHVKYFFKKAIEGVLPNDIIYRPKQGFRTPVVEMFRGEFGDWARPIILDQGLTRTGLLRRSHLESLLSAHRQGRQDYSNRLWTVMMLNLWHDRWITGSSKQRSPDPKPAREPAGREQPVAGATAS